MFNSFLYVYQRVSTEGTTLNDQPKTEAALQLDDFKAAYQNFAKALAMALAPG